MKVTKLSLFNIKHVALIIAVTGLLLSSVIMPVHKAQASTTTDLLAQIQQLMQMVTSLQQQLTLQGGGTAVASNLGNSCVALTRSMYLGLSDASTAGEVSRLQRFLKNTGYYTYGEITGYFGPATQEAVQRWQSANGIVSSGSPDSTGYGLIGSQTRAAMSRGCIAESVTSLPAPVFVEKDNKVKNDGTVSVRIISPNKGAFIYGDNVKVIWNQKGSVPKGSKACVTLRRKTDEKNFAFPASGGSCVAIAGKEPLRTVMGEIIRTSGYDLTPGEYRAVVTINGPSVGGKEGEVLAIDKSDSYFTIRNDVVTATFDQDSLVSSSPHPTITGTATNISSVSVAIKGYTGATAKVVNGHWSVTIPDTLPSGKYSLELINVDTNTVVSHTVLTVTNSLGTITFLPSENGETIDLKNGQTATDGEFQITLTGVGINQATFRVDAKGVSSYYVNLTLGGSGFNTSDLSSPTGNINVSLSSISGKNNSVSLLIKSAVKG